MFEKEIKRAAIDSIKQTVPSLVAEILDEMKCVMCRAYVLPEHQSIHYEQSCHEWCETYY